jgi:hypothetical protein
MEPKKYPAASGRRLARIKRRLSSEAPPRSKSHQRLALPKFSIKPTKQKVKVSLPRMRWSFKGLLKVGAAAFIFFWLFIGGGLLTAYVFLDANDLSALLKDMVEKQTGGRLEISQTRFGVWNGLNIDGVKFYPPVATDTRGFINGGQVTDRPLIEIAQVDLNYNAAELFVGKVHVTAVAIQEPNVFLEKTGEEWNFSGIQKYRDRHFPAEQAEVTPPQMPVEPFTTDKILPVPRSMLFLPFALEVSFVGVKNMQLELQQHSAASPKPSPQSTIFLKGLDLGAGLTWVGNASRVWVKVNGHEKDELQFSQEVYGEKPQITQFEGKVATEIAFKNLSELALDLNFVGKRIAAGDLVLKDLTASSKMRIDLAPQFNGMKFRQFDVNLLEAIKYQLTGDVALPRNNFDLYRLNVNQKLQLKLAKLNPYIRQFLPKSTLAGELTLDRLSIEGDVEPAKLSIDKLDMPRIQTALTLKDVTVLLEDIGLRTSPIDGSFSVVAANALSGGGSQLDAAFDLGFESIDFIPPDQKKKMQLAVKDFAAKFTTRLLYPQTEVPLLKLSARAEHVIGDVPDLETIDVPFDVNIDGDYRGRDHKGNVNARVELRDLLQLAASLSCREECANFSADVSADLHSLEKILQLALPVLQRSMTLDQIPSTLKGSISTRITGRGEIPSPLKHQPEEILRDGKINFGVQLALNDIWMTHSAADVQGFNQKLTIDGNLKNQKVNLKQDLEALELASRDPETNEVKRTRIDRYQLSTLVNNTIEGPINLKNIIGQLKTKLDLNFRTGAIDATETAGLTLSGVNFDFSGTQSQAKFAQVKNLNLNVPDFGLAFSASGKTNLNKDFMPKNLSVAANLAVEQGNGKSLAKSVRTSGSIAANIKANSKDLERIVIEGLAEFNDFFLTVLKPDDGEEILAVESINGKIPLKQIVNLTALKNLSKSKTKLPSATGKETFEQTSQEYFEKNRDTIAESTNKIVLVDYGNVRPFFPGKHPISIKRVKVSRLEMQNIEFDVELKQNWFALNQFVIEFLGGKIQGDLQFAFDPTPLGMRASVHLTHLDTRKLLNDFPKLRKKARNWSLLSDPYLDGSLQLKYNLRNSDLDGGIEITSIGEEQLRMILFYVDPKEENPTISQIKSALNYGELSHLSVPIKNGFVGIDVDIRALQVPIPLPNVRGFPISQLVENFKGQGVEEEASEIDGEQLDPSQLPTADPEEEKKTNEENSDALIVH